MRRVVRILNLKSFSIFQSLLLEEAILRVDRSTDLWVIMNRGTFPSIIMGISGKPDQLLNVERVKQDRVKVIRRFTGGGTVFVDDNTFFCSFIGDESILQKKNFSLFPRDIMKWSEILYKNVFKDEDFHLVETDYAFGQLKFGGNAQAITRKRFCHHTSFLWDYNDFNMSYLLMPQKKPNYRGDRPHSSFLCKMRDRYPSMDMVAERIKESVIKLREEEGEEVEVQEIEEEEVKGLEQHYIPLSEKIGTRWVEL